MRGAVLALFGILFLATSGQVFGSLGNGNVVGLEDVSEMLSVKSNLESNEVALSKLNKVLSHLEKRQSKYKSENDFVEYLYYYTHQKLLKSYSEYPTLEETLIDGTYDCLTATAIYSILLTELEINHDVIETNYHIYITVNSDTNDELLLETTDPRNGFVETKSAIIASKKSYLTDNLANRKTLISFDFNIERRLEQGELIGLLYYNQSIREMNNGEWDAAMILAQKALNYYSENRVVTLINIIDSVGP